MIERLITHTIVASIVAVGMAFSPAANAQFMIAPKKEPVAEKKATPSEPSQKKGNAAPTGAKKKNVVKPKWRAVDLEKQLQAQEERQLAVEAELALLKQQLAESDTGENKVVLTPEQQRQMLSYKNQISSKETELSALQQAIANGLDPALVQSNVDKINGEIAALSQQIEEIENSATPREPEDQNIVALSQKIDALETKIEAQQAALNNAAETKTVQKEKKEPLTEPKKEKRGSLMDSLGELLPVEIFAFGDFQYFVQEEGPDDFTLGQLELDVAQDLAESLTITAAIAYDSEAETLGIGAFTIDGRLLGHEGAHLKQNDRIDSLGLILGQFDVPVGIDYMRYASIDRRLVTGPIAVDATHGGWNDLGAQLYLMLPHLNTILYAVNGFGYAALSDDGTGQMVEDYYDATMALGGRFGLIPNDFLEMGVSLASFFSPGSEIDQMLVGGDILLTPGNFDLRGEYLFQRQGLVEGLDIGNHGMYATAQYDFDPVFITGRYSAAWMDESDRADQLSVGAGVSVMENAEIRMEYSSSLEAGGSVVFLQLAGGSTWQPTGMRR